MQWPLQRLAWHAPAWDAGSGGSAFVPGFGRKHEAFWGGIVLQEHPLRDEHISCWCLQHGTSSTEVPYMCFTVTAAALAGSTHQTSDGSSRRTLK